MESFWGPTNILPTKSMHNVVTSIATKLTHLIISSQNKESTEGDVIYDESTYNNLVQTAESTNNALKHLAEVTLENISQRYPEDGAIYNEMEIATQNLILAGGKLVLCCQILASTVQYKTSSQRHRPNKQQVNLQENISKTFQSLVVVLLCVDNAEVRSLINLANETLHQLESFGNSQTMESLVENLSSFASFVHEFHQKVWKRSCELLSNNHGNQLKQGLNSLKHSIPMLSTACSMAIKYNNDEVTASKIYAIDQVRDTIHDIVSILKLRSETSQQRVGTVLECSRFIDDMLSPDARPELESHQLETQVQLLVQKVMEISTYLNESFPKMSAKSKSLVRDCQKLVELVAVATKMNSFDSPTLSLSLLSEDKTHLTSICRSLRGKMKSLTKNLTSTLMQLVGYVFSITNEPLLQVIAIHEKLNNQSSTPMKKKLQNSITAFQTHCDNITKVGEFVLSCAAETTNFDHLQTCIDHFANISRKVVEDWGNGTGFEDDGLKDSWGESLKNLLDSVVDVLDLEDLIASLEKYINCDFEKCHEDIVNLDDIGLSSNLISATGKCRLLSTIANHCVSVSSDPMYRNGLLCHVKQHNKAIAHTIASANQLVEDTANLSAQEHFLNMATQLKTSTSNLKEAILSKANHPQLVSDGRKGLRDFSDQGLICGMIKDMHVLNKKLASLGFEPEVSQLTFNGEDQTDHNISSMDRSSYENEDVDELFGTSERPIGINSYNSKPNKKTTPDQSSLSKNEDKVKTENKLNPVIEQLLLVCKQRDNDGIESSMIKVKEMSFCLSQIIHDSYSLFKSSNFYIGKDSGTFHCTKDKTDVSILEYVQDTLEELNGACNLIEETINSNDFDSLGTICGRFSQQYQSLSHCVITVLELYSITVKKFINLKPDQVELNISTDSQASLDRNSMLDKSTDGLLVLGRLTETLLILSSDVIALYKQEKKKINENKSTVINHMNDLLKNIQNLSSSITNSRKKLKLPENLSSVDAVWLQLHALSCSSKVSVLISFVGNLIQTVLGIRNIKLPILEFLNSNVNIEVLFKQYNTSMKSLSSTCTDKVRRISGKNALGLKEQTKLSRIRDKVETTCQSSLRIIDFLLPLKANQDILHYHGFVICHLMFLHQRFLLEVCRIFLVTNALNSINTAEGHNVHENNLSGNHSSHSNNEEFHHTDKDTKAFSQRLETLKKERRDRETDLFKLLSDTDNFAEIPIKSKETEYSIENDESNC